MALLASKSTRLIVQGITGQDGSFYTKQMLDYGTDIVGGVTPGKGGEWVHGKPVFDSVSKATDATGANASIIYVPATSAVDAIYEAIDAQIELIICVTEGIPMLDMMRIRDHAHLRGTRLLGPNCPGLIVPDQTNIGIIPSYVAMPGNIGIVSRSGTLTYDIVYMLTKAGLGQTACIGIGSDPIVGTDFVDILSMFEDDPETEAIVLIGETGGQMEFEAADYIKAYMTKPVIAYVAGKCTPNNIPIGHSGAMMDSIDTTATRKIETLREAGARIADYPEQLPGLIQTLNK